MRRLQVSGGVASPSMAQPPSPIHAALVLALACQGCAGPGLRGAATPDVEVSVRESVVPAAAVDAQMDQVKSLVTISAKAKCDLHRIRTVDPTRWLDRGGKVVIDLTKKVPAAVREEAGTPSTMPVYVRETHVGVVRFSE